MATKSAFATWFEEIKKTEKYQNKLVKSKFASLLDRHIQSSGNSRAEFAREVGCNKAYITKVLRGESNVTLETMVKMGRALGLVPRIDFVPEAQVWWRAFYYVAADQHKTRKQLLEYHGDDMVRVTVCQQSYGEPRQGEAA